MNPQHNRRGTPNLVPAIDRMPAGVGGRASVLECGHVAGAEFPLSGLVAGLILRRPQTALRSFAGSIGGPAGPPYPTLVGRCCRAAVTSVARQRDVPVLPFLRVLHRIKFEAMKRARISSPARSAGLRPAAAWHSDPVRNERRPLVFQNCCGLQTRAPRKGDFSRPVALPLLRPNKSLTPSQPLPNL